MYVCDIWLWRKGGRTFWRLAAAAAAAASAAAAAVVPWVIGF